MRFIKIKEKEFWYPSILSALFLLILSGRDEYPFNLFLDINWESPFERIGIFTVLFFVPAILNFILTPFNKSKEIYDSKANIILGFPVIALMISFMGAVIASIIGTIWVIIMII